LQGDEVRARIPGVRGLVTLVLVLCAVPPAFAAPPPVRCGTIVEDVAVLDRDLRCDGVGVVLRNPRSTLQLNGHTIASASSCADGAAPSGVTVEKTADGAQILGPGVIRGFVTGIAIGETVRVQVRDVRVSDSCGVGLLAVGTDGVRVRDVMLHRNGVATDEGGAIRVEQSARFALEGTEVFANRTGGKGAAVDLRDCDRCRVVANRIVANAGPGLRLDPESQGAVLERNVVLDQRGTDIVDQSNDGTYVFNVFERGDGLRPPALMPSTGPPAPAQPIPAGCGTMQAMVQPRETVTVSCPPAGGVRGVRNGVVSYRLLNWLSRQPWGQGCNPVEVRVPDGKESGAVRCTNADRTSAGILEVTCCLM
jgi:hypothetical protein